MQHRRCRREHDQQHKRFQEWQSYGNRASRHGRLVETPGLLLEMGERSSILRQEICVP